MHDYNTARETHDTLQKRYDEAQVAERAQRVESRTEFRILDTALPPTKPSGPNRPLLMLGGLMAALIVGVGSPSSSISSTRRSTTWTICARSRACRSLRPFPRS